MKPKNEEVNLLTANRFDEIKKRIETLRRRKDQSGIYAVTELFNMLKELFNMLKELAAEVERLRTPKVWGRGHIRPVIIDAQDVVLLPLAHQFAAERREQYNADRFESIIDPSGTDKWRVFCLRWGLAPPPGGWENTEAITNVIHEVRLGVKAIPYVGKHLSAVYLNARGIQLPQGVRLQGGMLSGVELPDNETRA